jgi:hypothetical protein
VRSAWHSPRLFPGRDWLPRDARQYVFVDESGITTNLLLLAYVEQVLVPALRPGDVVVLHNLAVHKQPAVPRGTAGSNVNVTLLGRQTVCAVKVQE